MDLGWNQLAMDLELDRKEIFLISVIVLMILAWMIGNLGGIYFGMQDEEISREPERADYEGAEEPIHIPDFVGDVLFYTAIIGSVAWLFLSNESWRGKSIRGFALLIVISIFYFLEDIIQTLSRISSPLVDILTDTEDSFVPDIGLRDGSQVTSSPIGSSIGILILLASTLVIVFFFIRHKKLSEQSSRTEDDISSTADRAITELHKGDDVRDIIIRNYQKMLIILEREGVKQEISFTPRELENMALDRLSLKKKTIDEMTKLFEEAKYSDHPLGEKERDRALDNFKQIKAELEEIENA
ncbi:MAG: DUF4129 domain-containing protein [Candidatus Thermoplasmatota archaeon]|nr:DUF4129 domain-containing protein [Candidatus Thermoplasmatota archaeon]